MATQSQASALKWRKMLLYSTVGAATGYALYKLYKSEEFNAFKRECARKYQAVKQLLDLLDTAGQLAIPANAALTQVLQAVQTAEGGPTAAADGLPGLLQQLCGGAAGLFSAPAQPTADGSAPQQQGLEGVLDSVLRAAASQQGQTVLSLAISVGAKSLVEAVGNQLRIQQERRQYSQPQEHEQPQQQWLDTLFAALATPQGSRLMSRALAVLVTRGVDAWIRAAGDVDVWDELLRAMAKPAHRQVVHEMTHIFTHTAASTVVDSLTRPTAPLTRVASAVSSAPSQHTLTVANVEGLQQLAAAQGPAPGPSEGPLAAGPTTVTVKAGLCESPTTTQQPGAPEFHTGPLEGPLEGPYSVPGTPGHPASDSSNEADDQWPGMSESETEGSEPASVSPARAPQGAPQGPREGPQPRNLEQKVTKGVAEGSSGMAPALKDAFGFAMQKAVTDRDHRQLMLQLANSICKGSVEGALGTIADRLRASTIVQVTFMVLVVLTWLALLSAVLQRW